MKDLMKTHSRGKFHEYSICGCQVKNDLSFVTRFSSHDMVNFGSGLILLIFSLELIFKSRKTVFEKSFKNVNLHI